MHDYRYPKFLPYGFVRCETCGAEWPTCETLLDKHCVLCKKTKHEDVVNENTRGADFYEE